jgi:putative transposase
VVGVRPRAPTKGKMPVSRKRDFEEPSMVFVTTSTYNRLPIFKESKAAIEVARQLEKSAHHYHVSIIGYSIMPTHIHLLIGLECYPDLAPFMQAFKSLSSRRLRKLGFIDGTSLWKRRFDDIVIYSEKQFKIKLEYIHNNPVKDNLVGRAIDWPYSSAIDWLTDEKGLITIDKGFSWKK